MNKTSTLSADVLKFIEEEQPERGYELCFNVITKDSQNNEANSLLGVLSSIVGNHELAEKYFMKSDIPMESLGLNLTHVMRQINNTIIKKKWTNYRRLRNQNELKRMAVTAPLCHGNVLEIGCANGDLSIFIASHGAKLYGIDIDPVAIDLARHKVAELGFDTCHFQIGNGYKLQFEDDTFDTVVVAEVLEHVNDPYKILTEAHRVCRPGGTVIVSVPNGYSIPDPDHCNIFTRDILNHLAQDTVGLSLDWVENVPSEWIMGTFRKEGANSESHTDTLELDTLFLPFAYTIPKSDKMVSVIIPTYNRRDYIAEAVESVLNQTHRNLEIIVVDDGSVQSPKEELAPYMDRITYLRKENGGKSSALNEAIKHINGDFIWVFDDDDIALPLKLELQLKRFILNPSLGMVHTRSINFSNDMDQVIGIHDLSPLQVKLDFRTLVRGCFVHGPTVIFKRECLNLVEGWDTELVRAQDYDFWLRVARFYEMEYLPVPTVKYRVHQGQRGSELNPVAFEEILPQTIKYEQIILRKLYRTVQINEIYKEAFQTDNVALMLETFIERASAYADRGLLNEVKSDIKIAYDNAVGYGYPCFSMSAIQNIHKLANVAVEQKWNDKELLTDILGLVKIVSKGD
ncbi:glycosyltransferase [Paenibacillus chitinolyticus]|uniref:glycosyltransferase n=1 Tax=Paenibacillus chitinolyticus TaxID=79263 RepID=UPI0036707E26